MPTLHAGLLRFLTASPEDKVQEFLSAEGGAWVINSYKGVSGSTEPGRGRDFVGACFDFVRLFVFY